MKLYPIASTALKATVGAGSVAIGSGTMAIGEIWMLVSSTLAYFKHGTQQRITCVAKASLVDGETVSVQVFTQASSNEHLLNVAMTKSTTKVYEFDVNGTGVASGNVQVNVSTDTTAIEVANRLATALGANNPELTVVNNANGTLDVYAPSRQMAITDTVANGSFTVADLALTAVAASGNMVIPASTPLMIDGAFGKQAAIIQVSAGGEASLTRVKIEDG